MAKVATALGKPPMPWQADAWDVALEYEIVPGVGVRPCYREVVITVPRQSGKTTLVVPWLAHRCIAWPNPRPQNVVYTAQTGKDATAKWLEHVEMIEDSPLSPLMNKSLSNGSQRMRFRNRSTWGPSAVTKKAGHGKTIDVAVGDEWFAQKDRRVEQSLRPAMVTRFDAQWLKISTQGDDESVPLNEDVERGRAAVEAGERSGICYIEFSASPDMDLADERNWPLFMPALGHTVTIETIRQEFESLPLGEFTRAFGNLRTAVAERKIPAGPWEACADADSRPGARVALAVDVSPDRATASIGLASRRSDGRLHVETIAQRYGFGWVAAELVKFEAVYGRQLDAIWLDPYGPAGAIVPHLRNADHGLRDARLLHEVSGREFTAACGSLLDLVLSGVLAHLDDPLLNAAAAGAGTRPLNDAWAWKRNASSVDITPLVAATLAAFAVESEPGRGGIY